MIYLMLYEILKNGADYTKCWETIFTNLMHIKRTKKRSQFTTLEFVDKSETPH